MPSDQAPNRTADNEYILETLAEQARTRKQVDRRRRTCTQLRLHFQWIGRSVEKAPAIQFDWSSYLNCLCCCRRVRKRIEIESSANDDEIIQRLMGLLDSHDDQPEVLNDTRMVDLINRLLEQQKMVADLQAKLKSVQPRPRRHKSDIS